MSARAPARSGRALTGALAATLAYPCSAAATAEPPAASPGDSDSVAPAPSDAAEEEGPALGWNFDGVWLTPLIGPAYTPELGFVIAPGGMGTLRSRMGFGDVPWSELGMLGSPFDLRGYRWGRYRQKTVAYGIAEYRFNFSAGSKPGGAIELSRHGLVGWLGVGTLGEDLGSLEGALPNIGVGYRFAVQDRLNARFDIGVGRESQALYFNVTEAF